MIHRCENMVKIDDFFNKIICGDSIEVIKGIPDNSIDVIVTSPPYYDLKNYDDIKNIVGEDYHKWMIQVCKEVSRILKPDASFILNIKDRVNDGVRGTKLYRLIDDICTETNMKLIDTHIWFKTNGISMSSQGIIDRWEPLFWLSKTNKPRVFINACRTKHKRSTVERVKYKVSKNNQYLRDEYIKLNETGSLPKNVIVTSVGTHRFIPGQRHPAVFPEKIPIFYIKLLSRENDVVLDPFVGSGTTVVACKKMSRRFIGIDISEKYCDIARKRLANIPEKLEGWL